jgi:hypothetical protein
LASAILCPGNISRNGDGIDKYICPQCRKMQIILLQFGIHNLAKLCMNFSAYAWMSIQQHVFFSAPGSIDTNLKFRPKKLGTETLFTLISVQKWDAAALIESAFLRGTKISEKAYLRGSYLKLGIRYMQKSNLIIITMKAATYPYDACTSAFLTHALQSYGLWRKKQKYVHVQSQS